MELIQQKAMYFSAWLSFCWASELTQPSRTVEKEQNASITAQNKGLESRIGNEEAVLAAVSC